MEEKTSNAFDSFRKGLEKLEDSAQGEYLGHLGKLKGYTLRLALVLEYLWWATSQKFDPPQLVTFEALAAACALVESYFIPMAQKTFIDANSPTAQRNATALAKWIFKEKPDVVNARTLRVKRFNGMDTADKVAIAISELVDARWLLPKPTREGATKGRGKADYQTNPLIWDDAE